MSEIHTTNTPEAPKTPASQFWQGFTGALPGVVIAALFAIYQFANSSQLNLNDISRRVEMLEKKAETNAGNIAKNAELMQQQSIKIAELSAIQQNELGIINDLKLEQREIKARLQK